VYEGITAAILGRDEAIALVLIEEFDGSGDHECFLQGSAPIAGPLRA